MSSRARAGRGGGAAGAQRCPAGACGAARARPDAAERLGRSARFAGFADSLLAVLGELESGLLEPAQLDGDLARLYASYREELDRLGLWDRDSAPRRRAAADRSRRLGRPSRLRVRLRGPDGRGVGLLEALAARTELTVSMPYEPGRPVFSSLRRTQEDLAALAAGRIEEPPRAGRRVRPPALGHLERQPSSDTAPVAPALDGAVRFFEGAGGRGSLELVAESIRELAADGTPLDEIASSSPPSSAGGRRSRRCSARSGSRTRSRAASASARRRTGRRLALLRFEWLAGAATSTRSSARRTPASPVPTSTSSRGAPRPRRLGGGDGGGGDDSPSRRPAAAAARDPRAARRPARRSPALAMSMLRHAHGLDAPSAKEPRRPPRLRRAHPVARRARRLDVPRRRARGRRDPRCARARRRPTRPAGERGRVAVLDLARARTRRFDAVFLLGLEEGRCPRRVASPFLDDDARGELDQRSAARPGRAPIRSSASATSSTRPARGDERLTLVREAATDEGSPREPSLVLGRGRRAVRPRRGARATHRRPLSRLTWELAPTERERLRALALLAAREPDDAEAIANANGWERRLRRARGAFTRETDCGTRACSWSWARRRRSTSPSSSASLTAPRPGSSSG